MALIRRRYYIWLVRAYLKRWHKAIFTSLLFGGVIFFALVAIINFYFLPNIQKKVQRIGYVGVYTLNSIPSDILSDVSYGLTSIGEQGEIKPGASYKWEVKDNGKQYVFYIRRGQYFHNKDELTAASIPISFKEVNKKIVDEYTVSLSLKSPYAPFLTSLSKPLLGNDLSGLSKMKIKDVDINGGFVRTLTLEDVKDKSSKKIITFYPTEEALKNSYALGDVDEARGTKDTRIRGSDYAIWSNTQILTNINYKSLVTLFYNTEDLMLSDKKLRQALSYAVPSEFDEGERAYSPIPPKSIYFSESPNHGISNIEISRNLIADNQDVKKDIFEITTTEEYSEIAEKVSRAWAQIGIKTKIKIVTDLPSSFQMLIYPMTLPDDPDQYTLWHSTGINNISKFRTNKRIDKLLEDGRSINDIEQRIAIYSDFQKYLIDDAPATFLYYPKNFTIKRR